MKTKGSRFLTIAGIGVVIFFLYGVIQLLLMRFSTGDVYPAYSSLRSDPVGAKIFYESLELCCDLNLMRNYEPFFRIKDRSDAAVLVLGMGVGSLESVPASIAEEVNYFIRNGGRLVLTFLPVTGAFQSLSEEIESISEPDHTKNFVNLLEEWDIRIFFEKQGEGNAYLKRDIQKSGLPRSFSTHTALYFQTLDDDWKTIYQRANRPVLVERFQGKGSLALSAESFFVSNEAMANERHPALLLWLTGNRSAVIFDEYHHGVALEPGVATLARRYHLEWVVFCIVLLMLLFVWKNVTTLVPPVEEGTVAVHRGKESMAGLTNLLRRNIPDSQVLFACYQEWQKSARQAPAENKKRMESILESEKMKPLRQRDFVTAYNALSRTLKKRG